MAVVSLRIPQIGEGLQEARLVAMLKQPGDKVRRDEPIYQMETDKAVMDVESPYEGTLVEWLAEADQILPIGGEVARMEVEGEVQEMVVHGAGPATAEPALPGGEAVGTGPSARTAGIPPRTRAYAKERGLNDEQLASVPAAGSKLMPSDIDAFLAGSGSAGPKAGAGYSETNFTPKQRLLASRLQRGSQLVVPGTMSMALNWGPIETMRQRVKASGDSFQPSAFTMFAYAVAQSLKDFPMFRSTIVGDDKIRTYDHVSLGVAVSLPGDVLVLAVVEAADTLDWRTFAERLRERIDLARTGKDQANEAVTISLTNMQSFGIRDAIPVVVPPAVGTLFLGEVYNGTSNDSEGKPMRAANMALTFDHRLINGVGAAEFMQAVRQKVESISSVL
jgi:pyruvate/2-oxoglutarate dehydrogenase complex dihydrolipoamide acyltransferase (E2) component